MIYFILPVHKNYYDCVNFVSKTSKQLIEYKIKFVIVNTYARHYLKLLENLKTEKNHSTFLLNGKSSWYWFKSIRNGLSNIEYEAQESDIVILCNVDVDVPYNYIESIKLVQKRYPNCIIGSQLRSKSHYKKIDLGPKVTKNYLIRTLKEDEIKYFDDGVTYELSFTSGRGMIFQGSHIKDLLRIKLYTAPHYYSDYCLSLAMVDQGNRIIMSSDIFLLSEEFFGNSNITYNPFYLLFSKKNPQYLPASLTFFYKHHKRNKNITIISFFVSYLGYKLRPYVRI